MIAIFWVLFFSFLSIFVLSRLDWNNPVYVPSLPGVLLAGLCISLLTSVNAYSQGYVSDEIFGASAGVALFVFVKLMHCILFKTIRNFK